MWFSLRKTAARFSGSFHIRYHKDFTVYGSICMCYFPTVQCLCSAVTVLRFSWFGGTVD